MLEMSKHFMEAIKVIQISKVKVEIDARCWFDFDVSAKKKMIIEKHILQVDPVIKSIANSSTVNDYNY
jgi:hypothetical protein